ncbi:hypothetical protein MRX96_045570 [Rhipicephalus microplus]
MPPQLSAVPHEAVHEETGARQESLWADMETDGSAGNATARKPSSKAKSHSTQNIPIQEAAQSPGGQHCLLIRQAHHGLHHRGTRPQDWVLIVPTNQRSSISQKSSRCPSVALHGSEDHQRDSGTMCSDLFTVETYYSFLSRVVTVSFLCT